MLLVEMVETEMRRKGSNSCYFDVERWSDIKMELHQSTNRKKGSARSSQRNRARDNTRASASACRL